MITSKGLSFIDSEKLSPFSCKNGHQIYQVAKRTSDSLIHSLDFEVKEEEAIIWGSVIDYSSGDSAGD
jgi:hypothetical protein